MNLSYTYDNINSNNTQTLEYKFIGEDVKKYFIIERRKISIKKILDILKTS